jgi:hypothetical protein
MNWLKRMGYLLWLDWHGYCPKHLLLRFGGSCGICKSEKHARKIAKCEVIVTRANEIINKVVFDRREKEHCQWEIS